MENWRPPDDSGHHTEPIAVASGVPGTREAGLLLVTDGQGDPATRSDSYRLMRLLWEQVGEIRCQFINLARKDEPTPDYAKRRTGTGLRARYVPGATYFFRLTRRSLL